MRFGEIFIRVWFTAMTPSNIISGFAVTSKYPFRPEATPEETFVPTLITNSEEGEVNHSSSH